LTKLTAFRVGGAALDAPCFYVHILRFMACLVGMFVPGPSRLLSAIIPVDSVTEFERRVSRSRFELRLS
jgi:hypothetical protein